MESRSQLQFHIKTVLAITIVVAIVMALRAWLFLGLVFAHLGVFLGPIAIVTASIVSGRQIENRIDIRDNKLVGWLLKAWIACIAIVLTLWAVLLTCDLI